MSNIPADLKYTKSHEWIRTLDNGNVEVGITDHARARARMQELPDALEHLGDGQTEDDRQQD